MFRDELHLPQDHTEAERITFYDNDWRPLVVGNDEAYKNSFSHRFYTYYKAWVVCGEKVKRQMDYLHHIIMLQNFFIMYNIKNVNLQKIIKNLVFGGIFGRFVGVLHPKNTSGHRS